MDASVKDLPPLLTAVGADVSGRLAKTIARLVETGGDALNPSAVSAAVAKEMLDMLTATGIAMAGVSAPVGAAFAPTGRFLGGAVRQMTKPNATDPIDVAQRVLSRQKNIFLGDVGVAPPTAPTIRAADAPAGDNLEC